MALKDLIQRAKQSRIGQAISNLDRDKDKAGFQFISPVTKGVAKDLYGKLMDVTGATALQQRQESINRRTSGLSPSQRISSAPTQQERELLRTGIEKGAKTVGTVMMPAYKGLAATSAGLGFGISKLSGASTQEAAQQALSSAQLAPVFGQIGRTTNPIISKQISKLPVQTPALIQSRVAPAIGNVIQGVGMDVSTGQRTTPVSVGIDLATGLVGGRTQFDTPTAKGFDFGRNRKSLWKTQDIQELDAVTDFIRGNKNMSPAQIEEADKIVTSLARGYLPIDKINKLAGDYGSNSRGFLKAVTDELHKSRKSQESGLGAIQMGLVGGQQATGYKNATKFSSMLDKKPRFEIDDSGAKLRDIPEDLLVQGFTKKGLSLNEVLDHPQLFKNYPELQNIKVKFKGGNKFRGAFNPNDNSIEIHRINIDSDKGKSTLLHEIQHAIQEIEGFARGGSPELFKAGPDIMYRDIQQRKLNDKITKIADDYYKKNGFTKKTVVDFEKLPEVKEIRKLMDVNEKYYGSPYKTPEQNYSLLSGELESRAVQRRMDLTPEQRLSTDPYSAEAIATTGQARPQDFITRFDSEVSNFTGKNQPKLQTSKLKDTLSPEQFQSSRTTASKIKTQKQKGLTFQEQKPVQGGSKLQVKPEAKVKAGPSKVSSDISISRDKKYSFNINKKKLGLNKAQSKQLDDVVERMRPVLEKNKGKTLSKQEIIEGGRKAKVLEDVVGRDEAKAFAESLQASRNLLKSEQKQVGITPKFLEQLEIVSSVAADAGRRLQAFNIGAEDITIKEKVLRDILKVGADADEVLKAGKSVDWNDAKQITDFYRKFKPATLADKLDEYRYTNMLSSPNTHINNAFSNFLQTAVIAPVEKTIRGAVSFAESKLTGKEQEYFARQGVDYAKGYWKALPEAIEKFKNTLKGVEGLTKPDVDFIPTSTSKLRQIYTLPLQALEASDQFFRTLVKGGELESLRTQGVTGAKAAKLAEQSADYRTFRQKFDPEGKLGQNKVLQIWDKWNTAIQNLRNVPGGKYLVPFLQTPTNILKQGVEYSPLGFATVKGSANPSEQLAKSIIGTSIFGGAYALADSGLTTWDTPTNATERAEFYAAGLQPYSVKIGDKWVSYSKLGPLAYPIAMASALKWAKDEGAGEDQLATIGSAMGGTLGFFADQSYVRGIGDIIDAVRGDEYKQARGFSNIPAQLVPYRSAMGWIARLVDPVYRKTSGGSVLDQVKKSLVSQVPFASKSLEAYQTPFGTDSQRQFPGINAFSPLSISQERPAEKEYYDARQKIRVQNKEVNKVLKQIEEGKDVKLDSNKLVTKQAISLTKKKVEAGLDVTQQELETAYLNDTLSMPKGNRYEKANRDSKLWSAYGTIEGNENLSEDQKSSLYNKIATELGRPVEDLQKYQVAKDTNNNKTLYTYDQIDKMQSNEELYKYLVEGRKPINGAILISDGVIDNLVNDGVIPYQLGKELKNLDYNESGSLKKKVSRGGGTSKQSAQSKAYSKYLTALSNISLPSGKIKTQAPIKVSVKGLTFSD